MRDHRLDCAKGILIILVVMGHCFFPMETSGKDTFDLFLHKLIYSFHMPSFMLLSGYFFYETNKRPLWHVLSTKVKAIVIPFICFTCTIWILMHLKNLMLSSDNLAQLNFFILKDLCDFMLTSNVMWFLASLFINCVIVSLLSRIPYGYIGYLIIFICSHFIPANHSYIYPGYLYMFPYFLGGYYIRKYKISLFSLIGQYKMIILLVCLSLIGLYYYNVDTYIYFTGMNILTDNPLYSIGVNAHRFVIGIAMSALFFTTVGYFCPSEYKDNKLVKFLIKLGTNTLCIYGFQQILVGIIIRVLELFDIVLPSSYFIVLIVSSVVISICYLLTELCAYNRFLSMLFRGRA